MSVILGLVRFLPLALEAGLTVASIIRETNEKTVPASAVEVFAQQTLQALPAAIALGKDVTEAASRLNDLVGAMLREKRQPTDAEWAEQASRVKALEDRLDKAAARTT